MTHDPESLASAYLDGELTDDERRIAEADPALMAEVDELRTLRALLIDAEPAGDAARDAAIGAAMAAFHQEFSAVPVAAASNAHDDVRDDVVVPFFRKFASPQWLGVAAAAAVLVVAVGVVSTRGADDADNSDAAAVELDAAEVAAEEPAEEPADLPAADADRIAESELADEVFAAESADEPAEEPAEENASDDTADQSTEMAAADPAGDDIDTSGMVPALDDPSVHFDDDVPLVSPLQLRSAALYLLEQRDDGVLGATPEYRCDFFNVLGSARYDVDGDLRDVRDVLIDVDEDSRVAVAVDRDECEIVATITLDEP